MKPMNKYIFGCLLSLLVCVTAAPSWAAIALVGMQCGGFAGTTSPQSINFALTGGSDAAPITGDYVLVAYATGTANDRSLIIDNPAGTDYTVQGTEMYVNDGEDTSLRIARRTMPDPTETSVTLSAVTTGGSGDAADAGAYCIIALRGVHGTPLEQPVQQGTAIDTILVNPGSITPTTPGTFIVTVGAGASTPSGNTFTSSDLTGFTTAFANDTHAISIGMGYHEWTSGAFAPATFGWGGVDSSTYSHAWMIIALAPAEAPASAVDAGNAGAIMLLLGR